MDIIYLDKKPVLYAVDAATTFQVGRFLNNISVKKTWEALHQCWINIYLGPPDIVTYNASTYFDFTEFRAAAKNLGIMYYQIFVEVY